MQRPTIPAVASAAVLLSLILYTLFTRKCHAPALPGRPAALSHPSPRADETDAPALTPAPAAPAHVGPSCATSLEQSGGFFCEADEYWARRRDVYRAQAARQRAARPPPPGDDRFWQRFWQSYWEPNFSCPFERRLGQPGDGGKWVCDANRLAQLALDGCLVYSIGSRNDFGFERAIHDILPQCEIHTFDHTVLEVRNAPDYVNFHHWGIAPLDEPNDKLLTFSSIRSKLGHGPETGRNIAVLKMDVEVAEWDALLVAMAGEEGRRGLDNVQQLLMEAHRPTRAIPQFREDPSEKIHRFFDTMARDGWVIFHKEANVLTYGSATEYAFLKLSQAFTADPSPNVDQPPS